MGAFVHLFNNMADPRLNGKGVPDSMGGDSSKDFIPKTAIGRIIKAGIDDGLLAASIGLIKGGFAKSFFNFTSGFIEGCLRQSSIESGLKIDSIDRKGAIKVLLQENGY